VTITLIRSGLINAAQLDQQLAKFIYTNPRPSLLAFTAGLIRDCFSADPPLASREQLAFSLGVLTQLAASGKATDE
jgi:CCR4-NOT transcription complex subunit 1